MKIERERKTEGEEAINCGLRLAKAPQKKKKNTLLPPLSLSLSRRAFFSLFVEPSLPSSTSETKLPSSSSAAASEAAGRDTLRKRSSKSFRVFDRLFLRSHRHGLARPAAPRGRSPSLSLPELQIDESARTREASRRKTQQSWGERARERKRKIQPEQRRSHFAPISKKQKTRSLATLALLFFPLLLLPLPPLSPPSLTNENRTKPPETFLNSLRPRPSSPPCAGPPAGSRPSMPSRSRPSRQRWRVPLRPRRRPPLSAAAEPGRALTLPSSTSPRALSRSSSRPTTRRRACPSVSTRRSRTSTPAVTNWARVFLSRSSSSTTGRPTARASSQSPTPGAGAAPTPCVS